MSIPKIEKYTECMVWDYCGEKTKVKGTIICQLENGFFLDTYGEMWKHAEPIHEKKKRWMTIEEVLLDNLNNPRRLFRIEEHLWKNDVCFCVDISLYEYIDIPEGYKGDFSDLEVKKFEVEE